MADPPTLPRVLYSEGRSAKELVADLGLSPGTAVLVIVGGAANLDPPATEPADPTPVQTPEATWRGTIAASFEYSVGPVVHNREVVVLTGGTDAGVMRLAGELLADSARLLVGVTPALKVEGSHKEAALECHHHVAVLTPGDRWGMETECLFRLAEAITGGTAPGFVLLANGGVISQREAKRFLRGGWPVGVIPSTGGKAADLLDTIDRAPRGTDWGDLRDADVEALATDAEGARQQLTWRLHPDDLLKTAWTRFSAFDASSDRLKRAAGRMGTLIALVTFVLLFLVLLLVQFSVLRWTKPDGVATDVLGNDFSQGVVPVAHALVLALPVAVAVAVSVGGFLSPEHRQRAARAAAESLKRAIYRYRALAPLDKPKAARRLAETLRVTDDVAIRSGIALAAERECLVRGRPPGTDSDELAVLTARAYLKHRVEGQLIWFRSAAKKRLASDLRFVLLTIGVGASSTALVGTRFAVWVAFLLLMAAGFSVHRQRSRTKDEVSGFDRAVADLEVARIDWMLGDADRDAQQEDLIRLIDKVEDALERESQGWEETMRRAASDASRYPAPGRI